MKHHRRFRTYSCALAPAIFCLSACSIATGEDSCADGRCCPSFENATAHHETGRCTYTCDSGLSNNGTVYAPDCGRCTESVCAGELIRSCDTASGQLGPALACASGSCTAGICCPQIQSAIATSAGGVCSYRCQAGFTNKGSVDDPICELDGSCTHDYCSGSQIRRCDVSSGALADAAACAAGSSCTGDRCCQNYPHASAYADSGVCGYTCEAGYENRGSASAPDCQLPCDGVCCEALAHGSSRVRHGSCEYSCDEGYIDIGSEEAPECFSRDELIFKVHFKPDEFTTSFSFAAKTINGVNQENDYDVDCNSDGEYEYTHVSTQRIACTSPTEPIDITIRGYIQWPVIGREDIFNGGDKVSITQWGKNPWVSLSRMFQISRNLSIDDPKPPNLNRTIDLSRAFLQAQGSFDVSNWDVRHVRDMSEMFYADAEFNQDLSSWKVDNVTDMHGMFYYATSFNNHGNPDISMWNVSKVTDMSYMFFQAKGFSQDISDWDTSNVESWREFSSSSGLSTEQIPESLRYPGGSLFYEGLPAKSASPRRAGRRRCGSSSGRSRR